ncbi:MAG: alcohol dehydrogenase catalytic domain-containing protein, partial [Thermaerobacter sp.]|nr:alcohol dehydrogenase catalytic domain-containing protein [Thermaerobacter sp.]
MNALVWTGIEEMRWDSSEISTSRPQPGWAVMQVAAAGVCGSELSAYLGHNELRQPPLIMGHEFSGTITAVGRSEDADWIGRLVTSNPLI